MIFAAAVVVVLVSLVQNAEGCEIPPRFNVRCPSAARMPAALNQACAWQRICWQCGYDHGETKSSCDRIFREDMIQLCIRQYYKVPVSRRFPRAIISLEDCLNKSLALARAAVNTRSSAFRRYVVPRECQTYNVGPCLVPLAKKK